MENDLEKNIYIFILYILYIHMYIYIYIHTYEVELICNVSGIIPVILQQKTVKKNGDKDGNTKDCW